MKRSIPLLVDRLEDRCVPSADPFIAANLSGSDPSIADTATQSGTQIFSGDALPAVTTFVIDPYLIDPNQQFAPDKTTETEAPDSWIPPDQALVPPIDDPFWTTVETPEPDPQPTYVIDPYLIDPNDSVTPEKPSDPSVPETWTPPDQSEVPPIDDPFWTTSIELPTPDQTTYVIDPYLIDSNEIPGADKVADSTIPDGWTEPDQSLVPPIGDPFWAV